MARAAGSTADAKAGIKHRTIIAAIAQVLFMRRLWKAPANRCVQFTANNTANLTLEVELTQKPCTNGCNIGCISYDPAGYLRYVKSGDPG
jgi:hypothetical protein